METINCFNCHHPVDLNAKFCKDCGQRLKCKECQSLLASDSKFCGECGTAVIDKNHPGSVNINSIHFKRTGNDVEYAVNLSDEVGKEGIKAIVESITSSSTGRMIAPTNGNNIENANFITLEPNNSDSVSVEEEVAPKVEVSHSDLKSSEKPEYPHINDLLRKRDKCTEPEWVLIFAFYESNFGNDTFTIEKVRDAYYEKRKNESRRKNFHKNFNICHSNFFAVVNETNFKFEYSKLDIVSDFILGTRVNLFSKGSKPNIKSAAKSSSNKEKTTTSKAAKDIASEEFDIFHDKNKPSLEDFYNKHQPNSNRDIFGLLSYYICVYNKTETFTAGNIDYAYRVLKLDRKNSLIQIVNNVKNDTLWFDGLTSGVWKLTRKGKVDLEAMFK
ncbi:MAG: hypothetical protein BGO31_03385 [Bacteroidetes bacterium 43-16]|nr:MAG: hypothetical protein BGO31_03385 [Bacteroidetes bacterium 43-16]